MTFAAGALPAAAGSADPELQNEFEQALRDFDEAQRIQNDRPDRARQLFRASAQRFSSIAAAGVVNGRLEFNIGNCHLQAGDVGRAILHYRRAQRLIPRDP
ncbi:MAG: tetratricopeptide repeat protein, partial [Planctomycetota bacterium]